VFPDLSAAVFNVIVQNPVMGAEELEASVAIPMETALAGLPEVRRIRSSSQLGVSRVTVESNGRLAPKAVVRRPPGQEHCGRS
jgi:cobalt-zinc-cadmium resistance protein CzcA